MEEEKEEGMEENFINMVPQAVAEVLDTPEKKAAYQAKAKASVPALNQQYSDAREKAGRDWAPGGEEGLRKHGDQEQLRKADAIKNKILKRRDLPEPQGVAEGLSKQFEIIYLDQNGERKRKIVSGTSKEAVARQFKKQYKLEIEQVKQLQQGVAEGENQEYTVRVVDSANKTYTVKVTAPSEEGAKHKAVVQVRNEYGVRPEGVRIIGQGVAEDLDANQKRAGQLGPTEKVKNNNIDKLVGANENFINTVDQDVVSEDEDRPYVCVHAKKGKCEVKASSSYQAAQKAAQKWGLKGTAGIDAYLADVTHDASSLEESTDELARILQIMNHKR